MTCRLQLALVRDDIVGRSDNCIVMAQNRIVIRVTSSASQQNLQCLFHHCIKVHHQADAQNHREYLRVPISRWTRHAGKDHLHDQVSPSPNGDIAIMTFSFTAAARWARMIHRPSPRRWEEGQKLRSFLLPYALLSSLSCAASLS